MSVTINASTSSGLVQSADTSGTVEIQSNGTTKFNVASTGAYGQLVSGTAVASTSGTSIDFTSIPSWVKRITVACKDVQTNGTSYKLVQIGSGSVTTSGYTSFASVVSSTGNGFTSSSDGMIVLADSSSLGFSGQVVLALVGSNTWCASYAGQATAHGASIGGGNIVLGGTLDRVRFTTVNGTDTFDAGLINILYEG